MSTTRTAIARTLIGIACIAVATCALVWFAFQFAPGTPRSVDSSDDRYGASIAGTGNGRYVAQAVVDVPFGQTFTAQGVTRGKWFSWSEEERASWSEEERERFLTEYQYILEIDGIEITPTDMKAVTLDAFAEWYPHYAQTTGYTQAHGHECKVLLVDVTMTNTADYAQRMPPLALWSEELNGAGDVLDQGVGSDGGYLLSELYGIDSGKGLGQYALPDDWDVLEPGETRTWTLPRLVYRSTFANPEAYDDIDPSKFCLALADYDPPTIYRLWLG